MPLASGAKLEPYEIVSPLGAGGMGEVYRARDARLGRDVAIKILPQSFTHDSDRLRRFEQEARVVAALNHPNILAVFDIGRYDGSPFLVSELLEGESLRDVLDRGPLSHRKTIEYGVQIAHGLAAAHEKGIVHRDLKPENVFITKDGRIKILDFGLAKLAQAAGDDDVTLSASRTEAGVVMGTASYMAPEQVHCETIDPRTDIFAFGAVLYEMMSGIRAFRRETAAETMTAVLKDDPAELSHDARTVSPTLERIVRRCLEKSPELRFQSARDLSFALSAFSGTETSSVARAAATAAPRRFPVLPVLAAALALVAVVTATWLIARRQPPAARMQFALAVPDEMSISHMALSRDGMMLVFVSPEESSDLPMLFVQRVGSPNVTPLPGTQGASYPFWSPDGAYVGFFAHGKLQKIAISGGPPQPLTGVLAARGGSWSNQDVILFTPDPGSGVWRIGANGTGLAPVTQDILLRNTRQQTHRWPVFLPDGKRFLYWAGNFANAKNDQVSGIYLSSLDGKDQKLVILCHSNFNYDSHELFFADDQRQLVSVAFDPSSGQVSGNVTPVANQVGYQPSTYWAALAVSANGTVIYNTGVGAAQSVLTWIDRSGKELGKIGEPGIMANPTLSPDGNRVAVDITDTKANNVDIWQLSTNGASNARFTFDPAEETDGVWSRDGSLIAYRGVIPDGSTIDSKPASGLEREKHLSRGATIDDFLANSWSLDDKQILVTVQGTSHSYLALLPAAGGEFTPLLNGTANETTGQTSPGGKIAAYATKSNETNGQISPDGRWVAYASDESGAWEIYVTSFPGAAGKWQVSRGGGSEPRWRGDGKEIFYIAPSGMLMTVSVNAASDFATGTPAPLFQIHGRAPISSTDVFTYDVAKDGKRFLVNRYVKPEHVPPLTILLNTANANPSP
ncbi:MAG TPA: protein kinase [Candidatus Sulfotelmatobacter sp.]|nr:protein kinase [Candidatus Sulfotelmatobacter sp.]